MKIKYNILHIPSSSLLYKDGFELEEEEDKIGMKELKILNEIDLSLEGYVIFNDPPVRPDINFWIAYGITVIRGSEKRKYIKVSSKNEFEIIKKT